MKDKFEIIYYVENNMLSLYYVNGHGEQLIGKIMCPSDGGVDENFEMGRSIANAVKRRINVNNRRYRR